MADRLAPCSLLFNCVCSRSDAAPRHRIVPFAVTGDPAAAFGRLKALLKGMERTKIVTATDDYLRATCRTRLGFADDLEFRLCPEEGVMHVRSAARIGIYDHGVNRRRVETLRRRLQEA